MNDMKNLNQVDVLFVGAGPANLAGAIKLKQLLREKGRSESVVVIEKADKLGQHSLSGAIFETHVLDELIPAWREDKSDFITRMLNNRVEKDETVFLLDQKRAITLPGSLLPGYLKHKGDYALSLSEMVKWLSGIAEGLGVEIYTGFAAQELVIENGKVKGIKLGEKGQNKEGHQQDNYLPGEVLEAKVTVLGEGSLGQLAEDLVEKLHLRRGANPQIRSLGVKEIIRLPEKNNFGPNRVMHTVGFPDPSVFGGGTIYSMGKDLVAVALVLALDWRYCNLNPQRELQHFKSHRYIKKLIEGGEVLAYGAKTLSEGGYYSMTELVADGALIVGDDAGLTNVRKLKGLHYAVKSGMLAAEAILRAIESQNFSKAGLQSYQDLLNESFVVKDLRAGKNYRQVFAKAGRAGFYVGAPLSFVQQAIPFRLKLEPDYQGMRRAQLSRPSDEGIDRLTAVSLSGTTHREEEPPHITLLDPKKCEACKNEYGCNPCQEFCPGEVYKFVDGELILSPSNCLHCQTCRTKCPSQNIQWSVPEGGDGPRYKQM